MAAEASKVQGVRVGRDHPPSANLKADQARHTEGPVQSPIQLDAGRMVEDEAGEPSSSSDETIFESLQRGLGFIPKSGRNIQEERVLNRCVTWPDL